MDDVNNTPPTNTFSGIWRSDYTYRNSVRDADLPSQNYVRMYPKGNDLVIETIPETNDSYFLARFSLDGKVATGSWQDVTNPKGDYKGAIYHGAAQLIISDDGKSIKGKWVGFGKNMVVNTGPWEFTYIGEDLSGIDKNDLVTQ